ncbi:MAG: ileS [Haloplasmataceae bacterium]|nr:ileS [Haloplasmataceae bacterium]
MAKDYKDTLLMMKTNFEMRGNLPQKEPLVQQKWNEMDLYHQILKRNEHKPYYVLHDGPPYANGNIHIGHALNKILKDFVVRYKNMSGFKVPYIPGWDTHGLPIETALTKAGVNRKELTPSEFRRKCEEYALQQVENQKMQFKRLGVIGDWENPYITLQHDYEAWQIKVFAKMVSRGLIYKGVKPVYWSWSSESALAEAEIEYMDKKSPSIYVTFDVIDPKNVLNGDEKFIIWTTTPWTIPANLAISVHPKLEYAVVQTSVAKYVVAHELVEKLAKELNWENVSVTKVIKGQDLEFVKCKHPFYDRESVVILGEHVTAEATGCVHTAPGHGEDDFIVGKKYNLGVLCPVDEQGKLTKESVYFEGLHVDDANKAVCKMLEEKGALLKLTFITHSYPHDWRTKKPIIFRVTPQWFASIDALKDTMMKEVKSVNWLPNWGDTRLGNMIKDRNDWCISRQRVWGIPIPVFYAENDEEILDEKVINHIAELFAEHGSNIWFEWEAKDLLPVGFTHPSSPNNKFRKETDIMDVWFDSGSSHHSVLVNRGLPYPADLYLEGSDQYRGWFNSSLSTGVAMTDHAPYKNVVSHGFVLDGEGRKMSKSLGNVIDPLKIINTSGADILRLWVASVDYQSDVRISDDLMKQLSESYRKIRNTFRFLLGNLFDFDVTKDTVKYEDLGEVDKYVLIKLNEVTKEVLNAYEHFAFDIVYRTINNYISQFLSSFYLDFTKDILYIEKADSRARRNIQTVFYENLMRLAKLLSPLIPHTTDEVYSHCNNQEAASIHLTDMPKVENYANEAEILTKYEKFMTLRNDVLKALEEARNAKVIGKSFNAKLTLYPNKATKELINTLNANLQQIFIVSQFEVKNEVAPENAYQFDNVAVLVENANGHTCARCWQVVETLNEDELCTRCDRVLK